FPDSGRNSDVDRTGMAVVLQREAPRRAVIRVFQPELDLVLNVAALSRGTAPAPARPSSRLLRTGPAEERVEEFGERIGFTEHLAHFIFGHRPETAAGLAAEVHVPGATLEARPLSRPGACLLVHPPVGAKLVVFFALGWIAEHFVGFVDLLELRLRRLVAGVDVRMVLPRELPVCLLDLLLGRGLGHAERRVVILEIHSQSNPSIRLSSSSSCARRRRASRAERDSSRMSGRIR